MGLLLDSPGRFLSRLLDLAHEGPQIGFDAAKLAIAFEPFVDRHALPRCSGQWASVVDRFGPVFSPPVDERQQDQRQPQHQQRGADGVQRPPACQVPVPG